MKKRNSLAILCSVAFAMSLTLAGCFNMSKNNKTSDGGEGSGDPTSQGSDPIQKWTITFDSQGGSQVAPIQVENGKKASKPADPTKKDYTFKGWFEEKEAITEFDFNTAITSNWTLYAGWTNGGGQVDPPDPPEPPVTNYDFYVSLEGNVYGASKQSYDLLDTQVAEYRVDVGNIVEGQTIAILNSEKVALSENFGAEPGDNNVSGDVGSFTIHNTAEDAFVLIKTWESGWTNFYVSGYQSGGGDVDPGTAHGPEGSELVDWYIVGQGSLFSDSWSIDGGIQLYSNPSSLTDKGCILSLTIEAGNIFKVTDGDTWFGYEKVDTWADPSNLGINNFSAADDGYGGTNIQCDVTGCYDIYVNSSGNFWIQAAAEA